jgi:hypothetical protein
MLLEITLEGVTSTRSVTMTELVLEFDFRVYVVFDALGRERTNVEFGLFNFTICCARRHTLSNILSFQHGQSFLCTYDLPIFVSENYGVEPKVKSDENFRVRTHVRAEPSSRATPKITATAGICSLPRWFINRVFYSWSNPLYIY